MRQHAWVGDPVVGSKHAGCPSLAPPPPAIHSRPFAHWDLPTCSGLPTSASEALGLLPSFCSSVTISYRRRRRW